MALSSLLFLKIKCIIMSWQWPPARHVLFCWLPCPLCFFLPSSSPYPTHKKSWFWPPLDTFFLATTVLNVRSLFSLSHVGTDKELELTPSLMRHGDNLVFLIPIFPYPCTWSPLSMGDRTECSCEILTNMNAVKL